MGSVALPAPIKAYFDAVRAGDLGALVAAFHRDARIRDVDRDIVGIERIRRWAKDEVIGGQYEPHEVHPSPDGVRILLTFRPVDMPGGFRAWYDVHVRQDKIASMDLQYA